MITNVYVEIRKGIVNGLSRCHNGRCRSYITHQLQKFMKTWGDRTGGNETATSVFYSKLITYVSYCEVIILYSSSLVIGKFSLKKQRNVYFWQNFSALFIHLLPSLFTVHAKA